MKIEKYLKEDKNDDILQVLIDTCNVIKKAWGDKPTDWNLAKQLDKCDEIIKKAKKRR